MPGRIFFKRYKQAYSKTFIEKQGTRIARKKLKNKNKVEGITLLNFIFYFRASVIKPGGQL